MTQIIQVLGISNTVQHTIGSILPRPITPGRVDNSPKKLLTKKYLNPFNKTEGEFELELLLERTLILKSYYGDEQGIYQAAENMIFNAVRKGLHTTPGNTSFGFLPKELNPVASAIRRAKRKTATSRRGQTVRIAGGFDPYSSGNLIDVDAFCQSIQNQLNSVQNQISDIEDNDPYYGVLQSQINQLQNELNNCNNLKPTVEILNDYLEESAHDLTYAFLTSSDINNEATNVVSGKASFHNAFIDRAAFIIDRSSSVVKTWVENGIMRQNIVNGAEPLEGRLTAFGVGYKLVTDQTGVGLIGSATLIAIAKAVVAIASAVAAAITVIQQLINSFSSDKQQQLTNSIPPPGSSSFNNLAGDWIGSPLVEIPGGGGGSTSNGDNLFSNPLLIGGGLFGLGVATGLIKL